MRLGLVWLRGTLAWRDGIVVTLHDETENPVDMVKVFEGRLLICAIPIPDDWKPLARLDQVGADQQTGDEAVKLFEQHRFLDPNSPCI
jgi:hypothetical protein